MQVVKIGKVVSVDDNMCAGRIKVALGNEDNGKFNGTFDESIENLDYCLPLLPKMLHVMPKEDELVYILSDDDSSSRRYYIGPIISQPNKMYFTNEKEAESIMQGGEIEMNKMPWINGVNGDDVPHAVIPTTDDIAIEGRKNCGIQIKDNSLALKAGVKNMNADGNGNVAFNNDNTQSYVLLQYNESGNTPSSAITDFKSAATIVADKINLIGNRPSGGGTQPLELCDPNELITMDELKNVLQEAERLPLGEKLMKFLLLLTNCVLNHVHPMSLLPPVIQNTELEELQSYTAYDTKIQDKKIYELLSDNVRIN